MRRPRPLAVMPQKKVLGLLRTNARVRCIRSSGMWSRSTMATPVRPTMFFTAWPPSHCAAGVMAPLSAFMTAYL
jgi:hypothetical protein